LFGRGCGARVGMILVSHVVLLHLLQDNIFATAKFPGWVTGSIAHWISGDVLQQQRVDAIGDLIGREMADARQHFEPIRR